MQVLKDLWVRGKLLLSSVASMTTGAINALVMDGDEVKQRTLGSMSLKSDNEYLSSIQASVPPFLNVTVNPSAPTTNNLTIVLTLQTKNTVFAAPAGLTGTPSFRLLVAVDIPMLPISKITDLQNTLNNIQSQVYYLEDSLTFDANKAVRWDVPRYINLENHMNMSDPGAYTFRINITFHCNHRQYVSSAWQHYQIVAKRTWEIVVLTDNTTSRARRTTGLKTISHSGRWIKYSSTGTSVVADGYIQEKYLTANAYINNNTPYIQITHDLHNHPGFTAGVSYMLYGKYTVEAEFLKTSQTT